MQCFDCYKICSNVVLWWVIDWMLFSTVCFCTKDVLCFDSKFIILFLSSLVIPWMDIELNRCKRTSQKLISQFSLSHYVIEHDGTSKLMGCLSSDKLRIAFWHYIVYAQRCIIWLIYVSICLFNFAWTI